MPNLRHTLPPLGTLIAFEATTRLLSFTRAAAELNLSQSAISQQIRQLERDLGEALFIRRRHDVMLTARGEQYARTVNAAIRQIADASAQLRAGASQAQRLVIYTELSFSAYWLMPRLAKFHALYPDLDVKLLTSSRSVHRETEVLHIAIQYDPDPPASFRPLRLCADQIAPVCSPAFRETLPRKITASDLASAKLIHLDQPDGTWVDWKMFLASFGAKLPTARQGHLTFSTYSSAVEAAVEGNGLVLGWRHGIDKPLAEGRLVSAGNMVFPTPQDLWLHATDDPRMSSQAQDFARWIKDELAGSTPV